MVDNNSASVYIIPHSRPTLGAEEVRPLAEIIASGRIAQGEQVRRFEQALAARIGVRHAACAASGTAALHLTLLALEIGPGHEVIIPSYVCAALLNAVHYTGAKPILAEIDPQTYNLDPRDVARRLTRRTKAIVVPHLFGLAADLKDLLALGVPVIEDCAQSLGSTCQQQNAGAMGQAAIFSFYATKVMTTGEGGMVVSDSEDLIERVKALRVYDNQKEYKVRYNYKLTEIQAAIGLAQLSRLDGFIRRRRSIARQYRQAFGSLGVKLPADDEGHIYYRDVIGLDADVEPWVKELEARKVQSARPVYLPLHRYLGLQGFARTEKAWQESLSLPIYPALSEAEVRQVIAAFKTTCKELQR